MKEEKVMFIDVRKAHLNAKCDEEEWVEREDKEAQQAWKEWYYDKERLEYVRENPDQFTFHGFGDMLECIRGKYFSGYASEFLK